MARPKVLVTRALFDQTRDLLASVADVDYADGDVMMPRETLLKRVAGVDGIVSTLIDRIDSELLAAAPSLRVVSNVAVGYNNIDVPACTARGVVVTNTPGVLDETTADLVFALLLASARRVAQADAWTRAGQWKGWQFLDPWLGQDVHAATLGIIGMGRIGRAVARRAQGFSMRVIYHNRQALDDAAGATWVARDELLTTTDFVVVMVPYSPATHHLIGAAELAAMKPTAHLINVARGGVVDDVALIAALRERRIGGAGLDVFENEPALNPDYFELENVTLTPHIGSSTRATRLAMAQCAARNMLAALAGEVPPNAVNPRVLAGKQ